MIQVRKALDAYKKKVISTGLIKIEPGETILDHMDYINMHLPYSNMGKKALAYMVRHEWRQLPRWKGILQEVGIDEPVPKDPRGTIESVLGDAEFMAKDHEFTKLFSKTPEFQEIYESKLASSLIASTMIGNLYTALGFPSIGEPFAKNVSIVIFGGPDSWIVKVGSITSSASFEIPSNPKNTTIITIDEIAAPIARDGPWINENWNFCDTFSLLFYEPPWSGRSPKLNICKIFVVFESSFSAFIVTVNVSLVFSGIKNSISKNPLSLVLPSVE